MSPQTLARVLACLRRDAPAHAWAIQDLTRWPAAARFHHAADDGPLGLSYLLESGHPASRGTTTVVLGGQPASVARLLELHLPSGPLVVRETDAALEPVLRACLPNARSWLEQRMDVTLESFRPAEPHPCRRLVPADAPALARFHGAPPQAAAGMVGWIEGACLLGAFHAGELAAIASTMVEIPEVRVLVSIRARDDLRGRGYGLSVTSALTGVALAASGVASLTVRVDNARAIKVYEALGYVARELRIWIDHGTGAEP